MSAFSTISDPWLRAALVATIAAIVVTLGLSVTIVGMRLRLRRAERRWERFVAKWRPPLMGAMMGAQDAFPKLWPGEHPMFLRLWAYLHESVRGDATKRLNDAALTLGIDAAARRLLAHGTRPQKLQAILAAGYLRDEQAFDALVELTRSHDSLVSVNAARALVRIDPLRASRGLLSFMVRRRDWDIGRVAAFLGEARQPFWVLLTKAAPMLPADELARALFFAEALNIQLPDATQLRLMERDQPPQVRCALLRVCETPALAPAARASLTDSEPQVRVEAARAVARLGTAQDVPLLAPLLDDAQFDVRMAAAESLARLPGMNGDKLLAMLEAHPLAADVLRHVAYEWERTR